MNVGELKKLLANYPDEWPVTVKRDYLNEKGSIMDCSYHQAFLTTWDDLIEEEPVAENNFLIFWAGDLISE